MVFFAGIISCNVKSEHIVMQNVYVVSWTVHNIILSLFTVFLRLLFTLLETIWKAMVSWVFRRDFIPSFRFNQVPIIQTVARRKPSFNVITHWLLCNKILEQFPVLHFWIWKLGVRLAGYTKLNSISDTSLLECLYCLFWPKPITVCTIYIVLQITRGSMICMCMYEVL